MIMYEYKTLEKILAYTAKKRLKETLEAKVKYMFVEANKTEVHLEGPGKNFEPEPPNKSHDEVARPEA